MTDAMNFMIANINNRQTMEEFQDIICCVLRGSRKLGLKGGVALFFLSFLSFFFFSFCSFLFSFFCVFFSDSQPLYEQFEHVVKTVIEMPVCVCVVVVAVLLLRKHSHRCL